MQKNILMQTLTQAIYYFFTIIYLILLKNFLEKRQGTKSLYVFFNKYFVSTDNIFFNTDFFNNMYI